MLRTVRFAICVFILASAGCIKSPAPARAGSPLPALGTLSSGWNKLSPGGRTTCALGGAYHFFVRPASRGKLLIYLDGGGACWTPENCDPASEPTSTHEVDDSVNPARKPKGIFDLDNPANPLADRTMVTIPYCTGDVHIGDAVRSYRMEPEGKPAYDLTVHHNGYANAMAVLEWVFDNFDAPAEILVSGSSAGSIPSPFYAQILAEHYPRARIESLGDASGGYTRDSVIGVEAARVWGTLSVLKRHDGYEGVTEQTFGFQDFSIVAGRRHPKLRLAQANTAHDGVQVSFLQLAGIEHPDLPALLRANLKEIRAAGGRLADYTAGGAEHTFLWSTAFYRYEAGGVLFRDWVAGLLDGRPLEDAMCQDCTRPELHYEEEDRLVVARARALLTGPAAWNRQDDGPCPATAGKWSLRCAIREAAREVGADPGWSAPLLDVHAEVLALMHDQDVDPSDVLREFNNSSATSLEDVLSVLDNVEKRMVAHHHRR